MNIIVSWPWLYTVTREPSKEAVERAANEIHKWLEGFRLSRGAIEDIARAALIAGPEDAAVLEGWRMVPIEPTAEMLRDGANQCHYNSEIGPYPRSRAVYRAMINAAPTPPAQEEGK